jgi:acetoin:2,6-dichlorophenolindophenol oxidoreductase subunit beta
MMREITYAQAIREALREEMSRDDRVLIMGEDVGVFGGIFKATEGLYKEFGPDRVMDTPISEAAIAGTATGAALLGLRPVCEIMFMDFITIASDQIVNQAAKMRYMFGGQAQVPAVFRTNIGAGRSSAAQHSQSLHAWIMHVPGLRLVLPSCPYDAKGLLKTAIRDDNPVVFVEHKLLYTTTGPVPEEEYTIPFGQAKIRRDGDDVTLIALSAMVNRALEAAEQLKNEQISVEVVDPRTLNPLDLKTLVLSLKKTHRAVVVDEGCLTGGVGAELSALLQEHAFDYLDAPVKRVAAPDVPVPFSPTLEKLVTPSVEQIMAAVKQVMYIK